MNLFTSLGEVWVVLLGLAIMIVALTAIAGIIYAWKERPIKRDDAQQFKLRQRLLEMTQHPTAVPRKSC
jgi:hypothetical protein